MVYVCKGFCLLKLKLVTGICAISVSDFWFLGDEDSDTLQYMWLHKGEPQRCMCGIFFRLEEVDAFGDPK